MGSIVVNGFQSIFGWFSAVPASAVEFFHVRRIGVLSAIYAV